MKDPYLVNRRRSDQEGSRTAVFPGEFYGRKNKVQLIVEQYKPGALVVKPANAIIHIGAGIASSQEIRVFVMKRVNCRKIHELNARRRRHPKRIIFYIIGIKPSREHCIA